VERVSAAVVSANFFSVFEIQPALGRTFASNEELPGGNNVAILSNSFWRRHLGADPGIIGQMLLLNGVPHTVIGLMPPGFGFPGNTHIWIPRARGGASIDLGRDRRPELPLGLQRGQVFIGRLQSNVSLRQASAELNLMARGLINAYYAGQRGVRSGNVVGVLPLQDVLVGNQRMPLLVLLGGALLLFCVACSNAATLWVIRMAARRKDLAIRIFLGGGRVGVLRQVLTESMLLACAGGAVGLVLAVLLLDTASVLRVAPSLQFLYPLVGYRLGAFSLALAVSAGVIITLAAVPAVLAPDIFRDLREAPLGSAGARQRTRCIIVGAQVSIATLLLIGAGLSAATYWRLTQVDLGFEPRERVSARLALPKATYGTPDSNAAFRRTLLDAAQSLPGVLAAGFVDSVPLGGGGGYYVSLDLAGTPGVLAGAKRYQMANVSAASTDYFSAMGIPLVAGRPFAEGDVNGARNVAIVNQTMARQFWHSGSPVGKHLQIEGEKGSRDIVGVVGDVSAIWVGQPSEPQLYLPHLQPFRDAPPALEMTIVLRASAHAAAMIPALRKRLAAVDAGLPLYDVRTMGDVVSESLTSYRIRALLLSVFAAFALLLAFVGVYSVTSYSVASRTHEIGVRMSLGAEPRGVLLLVLREGTAVVSVGAAVGVLLGLGAARLTAQLLFGVSWSEPVVFAAPPLILIAGALLATLAVARRASRIVPAAALRHE
jgi:putative ABC transport system permease protein